MLFSWMSASTSEAAAVRRRAATSHLAGMRGYIPCKSPGRSHLYNGARCVCDTVSSRKDGSKHGHGETRCAELFRLGNTKAPRQFKYYSQSSILGAFAFPFSLSGIL